MVVLTAFAECRLSDKALYLPNLRFVILLEKEKKLLVFFMKVRFSDNFFNEPFLNKFILQKKSNSKLLYLTILPFLSKVKILRRLLNPKVTRELKTFTVFHNKDKGSSINLSQLFKCYHQISTQWKKNYLHYINSYFTLALTLETYTESMYWGRKKRLQSADIADTQQAG